MRGEVLGVERRRRWSDEQKLSILASVGVDGATVTQVAQRHEVTRSQIYGWRYELKRKGLLPSEAPVRFVPLPALASIVPEEAVPTAPVETIEIELRNGRRLRVPAGLDETALRRLIRVTEAA
ncbi:MAG: transposase [Maritimibacter sp.]|nr:transposase [Maritimibacter sp.]